LAVQNLPARKLNIAALVMGGLSLLFVAWALIYILRTVIVAIDGRQYFALYDDAMISMRYAWSFAHGEGLVWNPGERVEGYTNLLMVLLMAIPSRLFDRSAAVLVVQLFGIGFGLANAYLLSRIAAQMASKHRSFVRVLAFACGLLYFPLIYWPLVGGDMGPLLLFLLLAILCVMEYRRTQSRRWLRILPVALGLAYLTRPDTLIAGAVILAYLVVELRTMKRPDWWGLVALVLGVYMLFPIGQTLFRLAYYGELLPNTYTLKIVGMPLDGRLRDGWAFTAPFINEVGWLLTALAVSFLVRPHRHKALALGMAAAFIGVQIWAGGDITPVYWRLVAPALALVLIVFINDVITVIVFATAQIKDLRLRRYRSALVYVAVLLVMGVTLFTINHNFRGQYLFTSIPPELRFNTDTVNRAVALNAVTTTDATIGVTAAGTVPYYTGRVSLDFLGKSDSYIAHLPPEIGSVSTLDMINYPGHVKYDLDYSIVMRQPTYVELFGWGRQDITSWAVDHYTPVEYRGEYLYFLNGSDDVLWDRVTVLGW